MPVQRWRWGLATAIVAVLGVGLVLFLDDGTPPSSTTSQAQSGTTVSALPPNTTTHSTAANVTSTTTEAQRLVEVELILQELWFGWFDAIYRKDPDALWKVVATTRFHDAGVAAMDTLEFQSAPIIDGVHIELREILLDESHCLVTYETVSASFVNGTSTSVSVMWPDQRYGMRFATAWEQPGDMWRPDCDNIEREETP